MNKLSLRVLIFGIIAIIISYLVMEYVIDIPDVSEKEKASLMQLELELEMKKQEMDSILKNLTEEKDKNVNIRNEVLNLKNSKDSLQMLIQKFSEERNIKTIKDISNSEKFKNDIIKQVETVNKYLKNTKAQSTDVTYKYNKSLYQLYLVPDLTIEQNGLLWEVYEKISNLFLNELYSDTKQAYINKKYISEFLDRQFGFDQQYENIVFIAKESFDCTYHVVQKDETLFSLSEFYGISKYRIRNSNRSKIDKDEKVILGDTLLIIKQN